MSDVSSVTLGQNDKGVPRAETRFMRAAANIQEAMAYLQSGIPLNDNEARRLCRELKRDATWLQRMGRFLEHDHQIAAQGVRS